MGGAQNVLWASGIIPLQIYIFASWLARFASWLAQLLYLCLRVGLYGAVFILTAIFCSQNPARFTRTFGYTGRIRVNRGRMKIFRNIFQPKVRFHQYYEAWAALKTFCGYPGAEACSNCVVDAIALGLFYFDPVRYFTISSETKRGAMHRCINVGAVPAAVLKGTRNMCRLLCFENGLTDQGVGFYTALSTISSVLFQGGSTNVHVFESCLSSLELTFIQRNRLRFALGHRDHATLIVPFDDGGWGAIHLSRSSKNSRDGSQPSGHLLVAYHSTFSDLLTQLGCGASDSFELCVFTGKWFCDLEVRRYGSSSVSERRYKMPFSTTIPGKTPTGVDVPWANTQDETQPQDDCKYACKDHSEHKDCTFQTDQMDRQFFCEVCGNEHDYKTRHHLNQHKKSLSHKRKLDLEFAAAEKDAKVDTPEVLLCGLCNTGHNYKTVQDLNRHNKSASHKKRLDPEVAAAEEAAKNEEAAKKAKQENTPEVLSCGLCNTGHNFKTVQALNKHNKSASHKKRLDPEFAAAEEAAKKAKQENYGEKETARKAARDQSKAHKAALKRQHTNTLYEKKKILHVERNKKDPAPWIIGDGTEEDTSNALTRYHGSTASAMLLHGDDEHIKGNIKKFIDVSPEAKAEIRKAWQEGVMATNAPFFSCGACGIRGHGNYAEQKIEELSAFFKFQSKDQAVFDKLRGEIFNIVFSCIFLAPAIT